jgi:acetyl-CoA carboxylase biotin carboxyl carrier protein|tara:strand:- start:7843 stop:8364 length:522 start_codon:yes stop_codon:yes gene_type:complete
LNKTEKEKMTLSFKEVAEIVKIIDASSCEEVVLESEGTRLVVRRGSGTNTSLESADLPVSAAPPQQHSPQQINSTLNSNPSASTSSNIPVAQTGGVTVNSPMVGTFYRRPSPEDEPFAEIGTRVAAGDPMCMIEVMKLFTTIEASTSGVVEAILAEDGKLVEFNQPLFIIRAD